MRTKIPARLTEFCVKSSLATLPCFAILGFSFFLLAASGELTSPDVIVARQKEAHPPSLVGMAYSDPVRYFKLKLALLRKPKILVLGTSRVLQFRAYFFKDSSFYNAGGTMDGIQSFSAFAQNIPRGQEPKVMIVGMDQNFFNFGLTHQSGKRLRRHFTPPGSLTIYQNSWAIVYKDYFKHKFSLKQFIFKKNVTQKIGFNAVANDEGYREDGSYRYGRFLKNPLNLHDRFKPMQEEAVEGKGHFKYGDTVPSDLIQELDFFLEICKKRNIHVVGFLPPYAHQLYETLEKSGKHTYLFQLDSVLRPLFKRYGFDFYNFSDLATTGASDQETIDGYHASEKAYLRLLISMIASSKTLQQYTDLASLENYLASAKSSYTIFED